MFEWPFGDKDKTSAGYFHDIYFQISLKYLVVRVIIEHILNQHLYVLIEVLY